MKINNQTKTERIEDELEEDYKNILTDDGVSYVLQLTCYT